MTPKGPEIEFLYFEGCPNQGPRLHWALTDPGGSMGTEKDQLNAFRRTRDELVERLRVLFLPEGV